MSKNTLFYLYRKVNLPYLISMCFLVAMLSSCTSSYTKFYKPYGDPNTLKNVAWLKPNEQPKIFRSSDFDKDVLILKSKKYIPLGYSSFNGEFEGENKVRDQAKNVRASVVLVKSKYTNTQTSIYPLFIPNTTTTYYYSNNYIGSTTTNYNSIVPITNHQRRYNQEAIFFVKSTKKLKVGVHLGNLDLDSRKDLERNTGAIVKVVHEDSPAFFANVIPGDILIKVNNVDVRNTDHAIELMKNIDAPSNNMSFTIIRNKGEEKEILIRLP